jgi:hypothetical protein
MINTLKHKVRAFLERINGVNDLHKRISELEDNTQKSLSCLAKEIFSHKAAMKINKKQPIHVVFVCHNPSIWGSLESVYHSINRDPYFRTTVVAIPYKHSVFTDKEYHDGGMGTLLQEKKIEYIQGYKEENKEWLDLHRLSPDYIFFQTPYDRQFPFIYSSAYVSLFARICYVPYYGTLLYKGIVDEITHPINFFKNITYYFVTHTSEREDVLNKLSDILFPEQIVISGTPKTDYILQTKSVEGIAWKLGFKNEITRILWTPRWRTSEGNCHFFDYKDYFIAFLKSHRNVDFLFRPHPLSLQNFLKTGELSQADYDKLIKEYDQLQNGKIDFSGDYKDTILSADILISDMSSILYEFFMTGKPIIYTHRVNSFNSFASKLATGFYWVKNQTELNATLHMLLEGNDPLKAVRQALIKELLLTTPNGAAELIKDTIKKNYFNIPE